MKKWINLLIFPLIGFGVGFFAGERVGEKIGKKNKKECCDHCMTVVQEPEPEERPDEKIIRDEGYISDEQVDAANKYFAQFEHPNEDDDPPEEQEESKEEIDPNRFIEIVDVDAWEAEETFTKVELFYYEDDEVVCDEDEHRVEDYEELIGSEALNTFGENLLNPADCVYIRNTWTESIYQVTRIHNAYGRLVLGLEDEYPI